MQGKRPLLPTRRKLTFYVSQLMFSDILTAPSILFQKRLVLWCHLSLFLLRLYLTTLSTLWAILIYLDRIHLVSISSVFVALFRGTDCLWLDRKFRLNRLLGNNLYSCLCFKLLENQFPEGSVIDFCILLHLYYMQTLRKKGTSIAEKYPHKGQQCH